MENRDTCLPTTRITSTIRLTLFHNNNKISKEMLLTRRKFSSRSLEEESTNISRSSSEIWEILFLRLSDISWSSNLRTNYNTSCTMKWCREKNQWIFLRSLPLSNKREKQFPRHFPCLKRPPRFSKEIQISQVDIKGKTELFNSFFFLSNL